MTPRISKWHKLKVNNELLQKERSVQLWFEKATDVMFKYRYSPTANFASQNHQVYLSTGAFGNGPLFVDELDTGRGLRYKACSLGGIYIRENHQGQVNAVFRHFKMTAMQALEKWPKTLPKRIREHAEKKNASSQLEFEFLHCVKPRTDVDPNRLDFRGMKFASFYVSLTGKAMLEESGYRTLPYAVSRGKQAPGELYARSIAMDVLPSLKTVNEQKRTLLKQAHRASDPILLAFDDGNAGRFSMRPGALNTGGVTRDGRPLVHTLPVGNVQIGKEMMDDERSDIKDAFLITLFQILVENPTMTATEVLERVKEKGILLAPMLGRQEEYLGSVIEREFDLLIAQNLLEPMPDILIEAEGEYTIEYDSPFSRSQRAEEATGLMRIFDWATNVATTTGNPSILDHFDPDKIVPELAQIHGIPAKWMRGEDDIQLIRKERQDAQDVEETARLAPGVAALAKSGAVAKEKAPEEFAEIAEQAAG